MTYISSQRWVFRCSNSASSLVWKRFDDLYLVYQPSSTETHIFNECTAVILDCLSKDQLSFAMLKNQAEQMLGIGDSSVSDSDFSFAMTRLEDLGLVECVDDSCTCQ